MGDVKLGVRNFLIGLALAISLAMSGVALVVAMNARDSADRVSQREPTLVLRRGGDLLTTMRHVPPHDSRSISPKCPRGFSPISGGFDTFLARAVASFQVRDEGWIAEAFNEGSSKDAIVSANVLCARGKRGLRVETPYGVYGP